MKKLILSNGGIVPLYILRGTHFLKHSVYFHGKLESLCGSDMVFYHDGNIKNLYLPKNKQNIEVKLRSGETYICKAKVTKFPGHKEVWITLTKQQFRAISVKNAMERIQLILEEKRKTGKVEICDNISITNPYGKE